MELGTLKYPYKSLDLVFYEIYSQYNDFVGKQVNIFLWEGVINQVGMNIFRVVGLNLSVSTFTLNKFALPGKTSL